MCKWQEIAPTCQITGPVSWPDLHTKAMAVCPRDGGNGALPLVGQRDAHHVGEPPLGACTTRPSGGPVSTQAQLHKSACGLLLLAGTAPRFPPCGKELRVQALALVQSLCVLLLFPPGSLPVPHTSAHSGGRW